MQHCVLIADDYQKNNTDLIFKLRDKEFSGSRFIFAQYSNAFKSKDNFLKKVYEIKARNISSDSFQDFLNACHGKPFLINSDNVYDFQLLAEEFDVPSIQDEITKYYQRNDVDTMLNDILKYRNYNLENQTKKAESSNRNNTEKNDEKYDEKNTERNDEKNDERNDEMNDEKYDEMNDEKNDERNDEKYDEKNDEKYDEKNDEKYDEMNDEKYDEMNDEKYDEKNDEKNYNFEINLNDYIVYLATEKLSEALESSLMFKLDIDLLNMIFEYPHRSKQNESKVFEFAKKLKVHCNYDISSILQTIDIELLSIEQIVEFSQPEYCPKTVYSEKVFPLIFKILNDVQKQTEKIADLHNEIENLENSLNKANDRIYLITSQAEQMKKQNDEINLTIENTNKELRILTKMNHNLEKIIADSIIIKDSNYMYQFDQLRGIIYNDAKQIYENRDFNLEKYIEIITPIPEDPNFPKTNLIEYEPPYLDLSYYLKVPKSEDNWLTIHFKKKRLSLHAFTLRTNALGQTLSHPKRFEIFGSNDNKNWSSVYEYEDSQNILLGEKITRFFRLSKLSDFYSYFRYRQYESHISYIDSDRIISLSAIEFFGICSTI
ncbi:hypothetical protein TRFO_15242 [Tritrichomonas foetus]|uniref:BTB domain-containing protein n=1 Tax=Tritrichomonas foetus TaxID=1144522 RepID=A0A1J4KT62_9EUKA|nr:hypothetical protein TRFO_15242 [Tritrichomonas foetus]|eukprot:OHT14443.1 hypothetical protein TRFO_15242 [Tritrichomonas foetus]